MIDNVELGGTWGWIGPDEGIVAVSTVMREHFEADCPYVRELLEITPDTIYYRIWRKVAGKELKQ